MKFIRNPLVILFAMVWTILSSAIAIVAHTLTLGFGDVSMWVGRHVWARPLLAVMGVTLTVEGRDRYEAGQPWVVAANHQGVLDIPVMFLAFPDLRIRFLAKKELFYIPVFGWYLWLAGHISVSRGNLRKAIKSIELAGERIKKHRSTIMVFPEGTRTEDGRIKGFKKGAFVLAAKTGVPVVPVAIAGSFGAINKNRWNIDPGSIHVRILDPIRTEGMTYEDRNALMRAVEASITAGVAVLRTEHDLPFEMAAMNQAQ
jgi:1-acyl-sn-glycerol-3-phosphate acyltransferase